MHFFVIMFLSLINLMIKKYTSYIIVATLRPASILLERKMALITKKVDEHWSRCLSSSTVMYEFTKFFTLWNWFADSSDRAV
jgi:hypothetical protein